MNDLFKDTAEGREIDLEVGASSSSASEIPAAPGQDTAQFFVEVNEVTSSMDDIRKRLDMVHSSNAIYKMVIEAEFMNVLKNTIDKDLDGICTTAREVRGRLEALERSNAANREIMNCQAGSSTDQARTDKTLNLKKKLRKLAINIQKLRKSFQDGYREVVQSRVDLVTGQQVDLSVIEGMIETGENEQFFQNAIEAPRRVALDAVGETQERHVAFKDFEKKFLELHQIFLDMGILVEAPGELVDDIEPEVDQEVDPEVDSEVDAEVESEVDPEVDLQEGTAFDHVGTCMRTFIIFCFLGLIFSLLVLVIQPWKQVPKRP